MAEKGQYTYDYPRPAVTVDAVVFHLELNQPKEVLLIERKFDPYQGRWALPGGFIELDEELEAACVRELYEETGLKLQESELTQVGAFGAVDRDPRGRTLMVAFVAGLDKNSHPLQAGDDAAQAVWHSLDSLPELSFDHAQVIQKSLKCVSI